MSKKYLRNTIMLLWTTLLLITAAVVASLPSSAFAFQGSVPSRLVHKSTDTTSLCAKNILIAFDGSGNNARSLEPSSKTDRCFTNIVRLHLLAGGDINGRKTDSIPGQISLYQRGMGGTTNSKILKRLRVIRGDLSRQTKPLRKQLKAVYEPGDKLFLIGFSRGAAAARKFAVELARSGLNTRKYGRVRTIPIEFLGCFDTVAIQYKKNFFENLQNRRNKLITKSTVFREKGQIAPNVRYAVHNVALDDNRQWGSFATQFPPVLMGVDDKRVNEVWFPGIHGDIGGKFFERGLNDNSCQYMKEWMEKLGLKFLAAEEVDPECLVIDNYPDVRITTDSLCIVPKSTQPAKIHNDQEYQQKTKGVTPSYRPVITVSNDKILPGGLIRVHESVLHYMVAQKQQGTPYAINPNLKGRNIVVVGPLGKVLNDETKQLVTLLERDY